MRRPAPLWRPLAEVSAREVAGWLAGGAAVVLPTETVYGLAVRPGEASRERVVRLKGRPRDLNLPIVVGSVDQVSALAIDLSEEAEKLAKAFWPGPLTVVMGFSSATGRPPWLEGRREAAIRMPGLRLLRDVALLAGPFLLTSANAHGEGAKTTAAEAVASLRGQVDFVVDGGRLAPLPSSIVNVRRRPPVIERLGAVSAEEIADAIGEVSWRPPGPVV